MGPGSTRGRRGENSCFIFQTAEGMRVRVLAAGRARGLLSSPSLKREGAGKAGCALHPRSRAQTAQKNAHEHTGSAEASRPSLRNGFTTYIALSLVTGLFATIASRNNPQRLTPASGRQNHTTSPSAIRAVRQRHIRVHRIPPHVRDDREPPLLSGETGEVVALICPTA
jgi:hypothetical protein